MRPVTRAARGMILLAVAAIALAGCSGGQPQPREYGEVNTENDGYFGNFMLGCTGTEAEGGEYPADKIEFESEDFCRCVFAGMKETVPFAEAQAFDEAQAEAEDGSDIEIPKNIQTVMDDCAGESGQS